MKAELNPSAIMQTGLGFDLPVVEPIAKKRIAAAGLADRISTAAGSFFSDPLPKADIILGLVMSLNMLIEFGEAFDFTGSDFTGWCKEAGFARTEIIPLGGPASAAIAYKP